MPHSNTAASGSLEQIQAAKGQLRAGKAAEAEQTLRKIIAHDKGNSEALSLLALLEMHRGQARQAKRLWIQALAITSPAWIFHNNLHNLLAVLLKEGAKAEAARYAALPVPPWPAMRVPDADERRTLPALVDMLAGLGQIDSATRLLESFITHLSQDGVLLHALGKLYMARADLPAAWRALNEAERALQPRLSFPLLTDLCNCALARGDQDAVRALNGKIAAECPVFVTPARPGQRANVLLLSKVQFTDARSEGDLHFNGNFPSQLAMLLADEFRFMSVFGEEPAGRAARGRLPPPDLILNNIANAESMLAFGTQAEIGEFADSFGVPVVNPPSKIAQSTRDHTADLLADLPGLLIPRTGRFAKAGRTGAELATEIEAQFDYPLIVRTLDLQQGSGMVRADDRAALVQALDSNTPERFFITQFVDSRGPEGFYRKIRAAAVGGQIFVMRVDWDTDWNVHGRKSDARIAFYRNNRHLLAQEDRICADPDKELGTGVTRVLQAIRERIPLDIFGVDFDVMSDGRLVFYEANATMNLFSAALPDVRSPVHAHERTLAAMRDYLDGLLK